MTSLSSFLKVDCSTKEGKCKLACMITVVVVVVLVIIIICKHGKESFEPGTLSETAEKGVTKVHKIKESMYDLALRTLETEYANMFFENVAKDDRISYKEINTFFFKRITNVTGENYIQQYYEEAKKAQEVKLQQLAKQLQTKQLQQLQQLQQIQQVHQGQIRPLQQLRQSISGYHTGGYIKLPVYQANEIIDSLKSAEVVDEVLEQVNSPLGKGVELALPQRVSQAPLNPNTQAVANVQLQQQPKQTLADQVKQLSEEEKQQNAETFNKSFGSYAVDDFEDYGLN